MINQGAPDKHRGKLWIKLLNIEPAMEQHASNLYSKLIEFSNVEVEKDITKDVDRTLAELHLWREDLQGGNNKLYNVLKAYANYDNEVGYVQGLNYIVGLLLFYIPDEEQVFWCLYSLMQKRNWRQVYTFNFPKLKSLTRLLEERLKQEFPRVLRHLNDNCLEVEGTFSPHFMTLYVYLTPIEIATRLFELFILDGEMALVRILLRMIELKQKKIMALEDVELQKYVLSGIIVECTEQYSIGALLDL